MRATIVVRVPVTLGAGADEQLERAVYGKLTPVAERELRMAVEDMLDALDVNAGGKLARVGKPKLSLEAVK